MRMRPRQTAALSMSRRVPAIRFSICKNMTVVEFCFYTVAEMLGTVLDLGAITIRQTRD
jgi:hypothetical protein